MIRQDLSVLIKKYQKEIILFLLKKKEVRLIKGNDLVFSNVQVIGSEKEERLDQFVEKYRDLWPSGCKGDRNLCKTRVKSILLEGYTPKLILEATRKWLTDNQAPYCGKAHKFLFFNENKTIVSRFKEVVEELSNPINEDNFDTEFL